jgi:hypothetical protein
LLESVGSVSGIGNGESLKGVRFIGNTAYVVTYLEVISMDPLFTIDVSDGKNPKILGELADIPGFSSYLHPMDENHLLSVGLDANASPMIQIFDVTDRGKPTQLHKLTMSGFGTSLATTEYKAFTYYPEQGLLAIPFAQYSGSPLNAMQLFKISVDGGISSAGQVNGNFLIGVPDAASSNCYYYGYTDSALQDRFSRSIFFDDILFAIAQRGIVSVRIDAPGAPIDRLMFSSESQQDNYYCSASY